MKSWIYTSIIIFLTILGISLFTINSKNLTDFNLQHMVMEAIVERRTVKLGGSYSHHLQPNGDVLTYQGNMYPIKQPGTGILGAMAYFPLAKLGHLYSVDYLFVSSWVSVWTSSMIAALLGVTIFWLSIRIGIESKYSTLISLGSILCTTIFPYSGFPHHDLIALLPIYLALYLVVQGISLRVDKIHHDYFYLAGFLAAFSLFFSILPFTFIISLLIITFVKKGIGSSAQFMIGAAIGIVPSLVYNFFVLGGLFHFPNLMGSAIDTIPHFNLVTMVPTLLRYFIQPGLSVILFSPLAFMGLIGWIRTKNMEHKWRLIRFFALLSTTLFAIHLSSFETEGDLQYGPRYLLPMLPLWFIGLKEFIEIKIMRYPLIVIGGASFFLNLLGALFGAMYKEITIFPLQSYFIQLVSPTDVIYPFRIYGIIVLLFVISIHVVRLLTVSKK